MPCLGTTEATFVLLKIRDYNVKAFAVLNTGSVSPLLQSLDIDG